MNKKQCSRCKVWKEVADFDKNSGTKSGLASNCRECKNEITRHWSKTPAGIESARQRKQKYRQTQKGKAKDFYYKSIYPEKRKARDAVNHAVSGGKMPHINTQTCVGCGDQAQQYHHYKGYDPEHWFDVVPVCTKCHSQYR